MYLECILCVAWHAHTQENKKMTAILSHQKTCDSCFYGQGEGGMDWDRGEDVARNAESQKPMVVCGNTYGDGIV